MKCYYGLRVGGKEGLGDLQLGVDLADGYTFLTDLMSSYCDAENGMNDGRHPVLDVEYVACNSFFFPNRFFLSFLVFLDLLVVRINNFLVFLYLLVVRINKWREGDLKFTDCEEPNEEEQESPCEHRGSNG